MAAARRGQVEWWRLGPARAASGPPRRGRPHRRRRRGHRLAAHARAGQAVPRLAQGGALRRRGVPLLRRRGDAAQCRAAAVVRRRRCPLARGVATGWGRGGDRAVELPGGPVVLEGRRSAGGRQRGGGQAAVGDTARRGGADPPDRAGRAPCRVAVRSTRWCRRRRGVGERRGSRARVVDGLRGHRPGGGAGVCQAPAAAAARARRPCPVRRARRRRRPRGRCGGGETLVLEHGADLHRRQPGDRRRAGGRHVRRSDRSGGRCRHDLARPTTPRPRTAR